MKKVHVTENEAERQFVQQLLEAYVSFRSCLPKDGYLQENKTTLQIRDELLTMHDVSPGEITDFLRQHGYAPVMEPDGTVSWAIWRKP